MQINCSVRFVIKYSRYLTFSTPHRKDNQMSAKNKQYRWFLTKRKRVKKPLPRVTDRVGQPVAIGQMLPRIKARLESKS